MIYKHIVEWYNWYNELSENEKDQMAHINCCERVIMSANEVLSLELSDDALRIAKGFGGGMKIESTCGVITGGVMALSKYYFDDSRLNDIVADFILSYERMYGSISCDHLKDHYRTEDKGCQPVIINAGQLLDEIINKYGKEA